MIDSLLVRLVLLRQRVDLVPLLSDNVTCFRPIAFDRANQFHAHRLPHLLREHVIVRQVIHALVGLRTQRLISTAGERALAGGAVPLFSGC